MSVCFYVKAIHCERVFLYVFPFFVEERKNYSGKLVFNLKFCFLSFVEIKRRDILKFLERIKIKIKRLSNDCKKILNVLKYFGMTDLSLFGVKKLALNREQKLCLDREIKNGVILWLTEKVSAADSAADKCNS